jgi:hypothetical protein
MPRRNSQFRRRAQIEDDNSENYLRSRTISGFTPSSEEMTQKVLERNLVQKKLSRKKRSLRVGIILLLLVGVGLFSFSQFTSGVTQVEYDNLSSTVVENDEYIETANQYLSEHPSERFAWSFKSDLFGEVFLNQHPEVETVRLANQILPGGTLRLKLRQPVAVWKSQKNNYFVDANGYVFEKNYFALPEIEIVDQSRIGMEQGSVASRRLLEFIGKIISGVESSGVGKIQNVTIPVNAIRYIEIKLVEHNFPIKVQTDRDAAGQVQDIVNMLEYLRAGNITPNYIDVRVKNRGFWR